VSPSERGSSSLAEPGDCARGGLEPPLAAASRRLNSDLTRPRGKLGRPRKTVEARPDALRTPRNPQLARAPESAENGQTPAAPHYEADGSRLIGVRDAGAFLGVSPWTVRDLIRAGHLPRVVLPLGGRRCWCGSRISWLLSIGRSVDLRFHRRDRVALGCSGSRTLLRGSSWRDQQSGNASEANSPRIGQGTASAEGSRNRGGAMMGTTGPATNRSGRHQRRKSGEGGIIRMKGSPFLWIKWQDATGQVHRESCKSANPEAAERLLINERRARTPHSARRRPPIVPRHRGGRR
jgi:hypothetical protein